MNSIEYNRNTLSTYIDIVLNTEYRHPMSKEYLGTVIEGEIVFKPGPAILEQRITTYGICQLVLRQGDDRASISQVEVSSLDFYFVGEGKVESKVHDDLRQRDQEIARLQSAVNVEAERRKLAEDNLKKVSQYAADCASRWGKVEIYLAKSEHENEHLRKRVRLQAASIRAHKEHLAKSEQEKVVLSNNVDQFRKAAARWHREALHRSELAQKLAQRPEFPEELLPFFEVVADYYQDNNAFYDEEEHFRDALAATLEFMNSDFFIQDHSYWNAHFQDYTKLKKQVQDFQTRDTVRIENPKKIERLKRLLKKAMSRARQLRNDWHLAEAARKAWNHDYKVILEKHQQLRNDLRDPILLDEQFRQSVREGDGVIQLDVINEDKDLDLYGWMAGGFEVYQLCHSGQGIAMIIL